MNNLSPRPIQCPVCAESEDLRAAHGDAPTRAACGWCGLEFCTASVPPHLEALPAGVRRPHALSSVANLEEETAPRRLARKLEARILPGGSVFLTAPARGRRSTEPTDEGPALLWTPEALTLLLEGAGFRDVAVEASPMTGSDLLPGADEGAGLLAALARGIAGVANLLGLGRGRTLHAHARKPETLAVPSAAGTVSEPPFPSSRDLPEAA